MEFRPLSGALGAEVWGLDLAHPLDETTLTGIRRALGEHAIVYFREQTLAPEQQVALTRHLGPPLIVPYVEPLPEHPEIIAVLKEADEQNISTFGGTWHSDFSFLEAPPSYTLLYAREVPFRGGDTIWANMALAYETLSGGMKELLEGLSAVHSGVPYGTHGPPPDAPVTSSIKMARGDPAADAEIAHPVVRRHPETGKSALFVNPVYTTRFKDMTAGESRPLLETLQAHATRAELTCRLCWEAGTLAIWDNRCTQHMAVNDYDGQRRLLHRTTVTGERPIPAG
jgi:taurine dioxygenase